MSDAVAGDVVQQLEPAALALALVLGVGLGLAVLAAAPRRRTNRLLAGLLVLSGVGTFLYGDWGALSRHPATAVYGGLSSAALTFLYIELLLAVLDTPVLAPLRRPAARVALVIALVLSLVPMGFALRDELARPTFDIDAVYETQGPVLLLSLLAVVYGLVASVSAWRRAERGSPTRTRAGHFALAFGVRDGIVVLAIVSMALPAAPFGVDRLAWPLALILSVPLLAYGILRTQLFDIDLRLKEGVRRGTVVLGLLAAFGVLAAVVQRYSAEGWVLAAAAVGVGLLLAAFSPLERLGGRVADRIFPGVRADEEYISQRKLEVYRVALEDSLAHDATAVAADPLLRRLRASLDVTEEQHAVLLVALRPRPSQAATPPAPFEVVAELGRGGFGRALLARDKHLDRYVVLKQPLGLLAAGSAGRDMFLREARLAAQIQHPNVVAVHQVIPDRDPPILVLEHVDGESLADRLEREGSLAPKEVARIALDVLAGLDRIHRAGIVHRDLKPANILLTRDGTAKITDFGIAHAPADAATARVITTPGFHPGSPAYMSPEQARGRPLDARSDLYSLAVVLHEALTGRPPDPRHATAPAHRMPVLLQPPDEFAPVLERALESDPGKRFADAAEMAVAVRRALEVRA